MEYIKSNPEIWQYLYIKIIDEEKKGLLLKLKKISIIRKKRDEMDGSYRY